MILNVPIPTVIGVVPPRRNKMQVYGLFDDGLCYYVGVSENPYCRFGNHMSMKKVSYGNHNRKMRKWVKSLFDKGRLPTLVILEVVHKDRAGLAEIQWIKTLEASGHPLMNSIRYIHTSIEMCNKAT